MATTLDTAQSDPKVGDDRSGAGVGVGAQTEAAPDGSYAWTAVIGGGGGGGGGDDRWWGRPKTVVVGRSWLREAGATCVAPGGLVRAMARRPARSMEREADITDDRGAGKANLWGCAGTSVTTCR
uniref:DUF834 domain-containing protein n=1 Tax=Oryza nivara TaxID=4536 RepID=A0A0E0IDF2_ORYNI